MTQSATLALALLLLGWSVLSGLLRRHAVTGPLVFAVAGYLLANPDWGPVTVTVQSDSMRVLAGATLALILFSDASRINLSELRNDLSLPVRLLGIGLPLSIALGGVLAAVVFGSFPLAVAGFIGAALAPTDAALSIQVINDSRVPLRLRRALNVESGLNDGIATPVVTFMLAVAASQLGLVGKSEHTEAVAVIAELARGIGIGAVVGVVGAAMIDFAAPRGWIGGGGRKIATLAVGIAAFTAALEVDGNGFIAAFVAGMAFGAMLKTSAADIEEAGQLTEIGGELLALTVWFIFGGVLLPVAFDAFGLDVVIYAVLSLTLVRILPVVLALIGSGIKRDDLLFIAWFGPRGLASVVFAILAYEGLEGSLLVPDIIGTLAFTIALSVLLHGITGGLPGRHYASAIEPVASVESDAPRARSTTFE